MEYLDYTQEDANNDGIGYIISKFSKKIIDNGETIGAIIFQDNELKIDSAYIQSSDNKEAQLYYKNLNKAKSILLRKITFKEEYRYSGKLEDLFDYITSEIIPTDYVIWCFNVYPLRDYITQIGGFNPPLHRLLNENILLFSIDV